jgi:hypothetical protein
VVRGAITSVHFSKNYFEFFEKCSILSIVYDHPNNKAEVRPEAELYVRECGYN